MKTKEITLTERSFRDRWEVVYTELILPLVIRNITKYSTTHWNTPYLHHVHVMTEEFALLLHLYLRETSNNQFLASSPCYLCLKQYLIKCFDKEVICFGIFSCWYLALPKLCITFNHILHLSSILIWKWYKEINLFRVRSFCIIIVGRPMPKSNFLITNLFIIKQRLKESILFH